MSEHYRHGSYETWDFIDDLHLSYCEGNVVKYLTRLGRKGPPGPDMEKAYNYALRLVTRHLNPPNHYPRPVNVKIYTSSQGLDPWVESAFNALVEGRYLDLLREIEAQRESTATGS